MNLNLVIVVVFFVALILINCSPHLSFAKTNNEKDIKQYNFDSSRDKNKTHNDNLKKQVIQNNTNVLNDTYPNNYYVCGYPKHLTNYSFLEKINCD